MKRLTDKRDALRAELDDVDRERDQAVVRRDFLSGHPDLVGDPNQMAIDIGGDTPDGAAP